MPQDVEEHNKKVLETLEIGDLVEVPGRIYSHWAVYIGPSDQEDGSCVEEIVHYTDVDRCGTAADSSSSHVFTSSENTKACVKKEDFWVIAKHSKVKKNNDKDRHMRPFSREEIKERALSKIGPISYNVLWNNCEHFAAWCRNEIKKSQQVDSAVNLGVSTGAVAVLGGIAYGGAKNNIGIRTAKTWGDVDLRALAGVVRQLYSTYTGGIEMRSFPGGALSSMVSTSYSIVTQGMNYLYYLQGNRMLQAGSSFLNMGIQTGTCVCGIMNFQKR